MWNKKPETLTRARTEMLDAGVDLARVWTALCDDIGGLYSVSMIGGPDHARRHSVDASDSAQASAQETRVEEALLSK